MRDYQFMGSSASARFRFGDRYLTLSVKEARKLEWDLFSWLECNDFGHIHAKYSKDKVTYQVCRGCNCMQYRTCDNTTFQPFAWILSFCKSFFRKSSTCEGLHSCNGDNCACAESNKLHKRKQHKSKRQKAKN